MEKYAGIFDAILAIFLHIMQLISFCRDALADQSCSLQFLSASFVVNMAWGRPGTAEVETRPNGGEQDLSADKTISPGMLARQAQCGGLGAERHGRIDTGWNSGRRSVAGQIDDCPVMRQAAGRCFYIFIE